MNLFWPGDLDLWPRNLTLIFFHLTYIQKFKSACLFSVHQTCITKYTLPQSVKTIKPVADAGCNKAWNLGLDMYNVFSNFEMQPFLTNSVGRLGLSSLSQHPSTDTLVVHGVAVFLCGVSVIVWGFWRSPVGMLCCAAVFGFCVASFGPTWSEVTMLLIGPRLFSLALGYSLATMGCGWMIGAPVAGNN